WLDQHRLLTPGLFFSAPRYRGVRIEGQGVAGATADLGKGGKAVRDRLLSHFYSPKGGGNGEGWGFRGTIRFFASYPTLFEVDGVQRIHTDSIKIFLDGVLQEPSCRDVLMAPDEIVFSTDHAVQASYA